jgi:glycosyltransferase involved in cell wall biosynthesis
MTVRDGIRSPDIPKTYESIRTPMTRPGFPEARPTKQSKQPIRLAALVGAPIHYHTPLYRRLAADPRLDFTVLFASYADIGYANGMALDQNVLDGYQSEFLRRASSAQDFSSPWALRDPDIVRALVKGRYEVLWLHGYNFGVHVLAAATMRLRGLPIMFREEQTLMHPRGVLKAAAKEVALRALFRGSFGLYIGSESKRWFEHYGVSRDRLFAVPYAVDNERLRRAHAELAPDRAKLRRSFGLPEDQPLFLTVSRLVPKKQPLALLEAFRRARQRVGCSLLIVGTGELEEVIREETARRHIPDVALAGFLRQSEVPRAFACADAFVLFSRYNETWGVVVNEAMNFGLPVLVSDKVGSGTDLVHDGYNGYVIAVEDVEALSDHMVRIAEDPELRERLGRRSLEIIADWDVNDAARGIVNAVATAVGPVRWSRAQPAD